MRIATAVVAALLALPLVASSAGASPPSPGAWDVKVVDADQSFRGLDAVDRDTARVTGGSVSGGPGSVYRTTDGGQTRRDVRPPGSEGLSFRDVEAADANTAVVPAIGPGEASRVYRTTDGGQTRTETFRNEEEAAFYNCIDFAPGGNVGLGVSDPVDGKFRIIRTTDGGASWEVLPSEGMPDSTGRANFSASGDCLTMTGRDAWFGAGGDERGFTTRPIAARRGRWRMPSCRAVRQRGSSRSTSRTRAGVWQSGATSRIRPLARAHAAATGSAGQPQVA
ncbi:hypothetical protein LP422_08790 [Janibacter limosus]|uniref:Uncharacterized protein n=1 Tax=Janibacter limosus TaxID=53458 RepID=A0AC61U7E1_9MICO|nr:hypothetical protein [Janibacter limosus]UUZ45954.1 hypothetical protein LP422_08790 [Janibacter limosus]